MIMLVEAGLGWNPLGAQCPQPAPNKGFPKFFGILSRRAQRVLHHKHLAT
jgi:hypothetical protein